MIQTPVFWVGTLVAVCLYWMTPVRDRMLLLGGMSLAYFAYLDHRGALALLLWMVLCYGTATLDFPKSLRQTLRAALIAGLLLNLAYFKYIPPFIVHFFEDSPVASIAIPVGISYYTFRLIHYLIESVRGNIGHHGFSEFFAYTFLFPITTAGPIERFDHFLQNIDDRFSSESLVHGLTRIAHGLIKKFVVGGAILFFMSRSGLELRAVLSDISSLPAHRVWLFAILNYLYAYMDFSAYSDIAIGCSRLFGIRIMENFNLPVVAPNIGDFWKRWHMTLANWCQSYIYMPALGATRNPYIAVVATFLIIGVWHAGTLVWVMWGLYNAFGVAIFLTWAREARRRKWSFHRGPLGNGMAVVVTFLFVAAGFTLTAVHGRASALDGLTLFLKLFSIDVS